MTRRATTLRVEVDERRRVRARSELVLPVSAAAAWGQMRDLRRFITLDPLHTRVEIDAAGCGPGTLRGARLRIGHRLAGLGPDRAGRVLVYREGEALAFSDLSMRGRRVGFPHTCGYRLEPIDARSCRLITTARGRWTATIVPRPVIRLWIAWVLRATEARLAAEFLMLRQWLDGRG